MDKKNRILRAATSEEVVRTEMPRQGESLRDFLFRVAREDELRAEFRQEAKPRPAAIPASQRFFGWLYNDQLSIDGCTKTEWVRRRYADAQRLGFIEAISAQIPNFAIQRHLERAFDRKEDEPKRYARYREALDDL